MNYKQRKKIKKDQFNQKRKPMRNSLLKKLKGEKLNKHFAMKQKKRINHFKKQKNPKERRRLKLRKENNMKTRKIIFHGKMNN